MLTLSDLDAAAARMTGAAFLQIHRSKPGPNGVQKTFTILGAPSGLVLLPGHGCLLECWMMRYRVYLEPDEDGVFVATCPTLPGCVSQGRTRAEATANIREAIEGYLKSLKKHGDPVPPSILEEVIEVAG